MRFGCRFLVTTVAAVLLVPLCVGRELSLVWEFRANRVRAVAPADDPGVLAATFDRTAASTLPNLGTVVVQGAVMSRSGLVALVLADSRLLVHDVRTGAQVLVRRLFDEERLRGERIEHVGAQVSIAPGNDAVAVSYERQERALGYKKVRRTACWVVYGLPSGNQTGVACHPSRTDSDGVAAVSPAASGKLAFSPDGRFLYTTSTDTRRWRVR